MKGQVLKELEKKTTDFILGAYQNKKMNMDLIADDAIWFAGNSTLAIYKREMENYLRSYYAYISEYVEHLLSDPLCYMLPMDDECVSVAGKVEFGTDAQGIEVSFQVNWVLIDGEWIIRELITSVYNLADRKDFWHDDSRLNYKLINASLPIGILCCDANGNHEVQMINEIMANLLGYESLGDYKHSVGNSALAAIHSSDIEAFRSFIAEIKEKGVADSQEFRVRKKDYSYRWMQFHGTLMHDTWLLFTCTDHGDLMERIEDMEKNEEEADAERNKYSSMINYLPGGFHRCTLFHPIHLEYVSDTLCEMTGYTRKEIMEDMNSIYGELVEPEDHPVLMETIKSLMEYPHVEKLEYRLKRKNAPSIWATEVSRSVRHPDGKMYAYAIVIDTNEEHEKLKQLDNVATMLSENASQIVASEPTSRVEIRSFGYFEVFVDGQPIHFRTEKAREMLAILVDRRGGYVPRGSMIGMLWEDEWENKTTLARCRKVYKSLVDELKIYGVEDIVESANGNRRIVPEKVKCDLFDYKSGDPQYRNLFKGSYMTDYSWAEVTLSELMSDLN